jgi:opacity protein-like surface antigen
MKFTQKLLVAALTVGGVAHVSAQSKFEGPFVQGAVGYTNVSSTFNETVTVGAQTSSPENFSANNLSVLTGNIGAGYNFRVAPQWLIGVSVDYMPTASGSASTNISFAKFPNLGVTGSYQMKNPYNLSVMPGYELSANQLVYGKVAYTGASVVYSDANIAATSTNMTGYTLGVGYKQALENQFYVFAEGLYTKFQDQTASVSGPAGISNLSLTVGASGYTFLVGAGYRF